MQTEEKNKKCWKGNEKIKKDQCKKEKNKRDEIVS